MNRNDPVYMYLCAGTARDMIILPSPEYVFALGSARQGRGAEVQLFSTNQRAG
jgi:hypothetical protein